MYRIAGRHPRALIMLVILVVVISTGLWHPAAARVSDGAATHKSPTSVPLAAQPRAIFLPLISAVGLPSAQELTAQALAEGRIDSGMALLYRFYAMYGDTRLPAELRGSGSSGEDHSLWFEAAQPATPLDPAITRQLRPFLVRPDHPDSIFSEAFRTAIAAQPSAAAIQRDASAGCSANGWMGIESAKGYPIKVWAQCALDEPLHDPAAQARIAAVLTRMERYYQPMVTLMGPPVLDAGGIDAGGSPSVDIYLLHPKTYVMRESRQRVIPDGSLAAAYSASHREGKTASGFILLNRTRIDEPTFNSDLVHEFFHILQSAHNNHVTFRLNPDPEGAMLEYWFVEASAAWAEAHFVPEYGASSPHSWFQTTFSTESHRQSLHARLPKGDEATYAAYIWPFFMAQENGPQQIAEAWRRLAAVNTWDQADQAIDSVLPFSQHFRRFALRNLNREFLPGDPITPRYQDYVRTYFSGAVPGDAAFPDDRGPALSGQDYLPIDDPRQQAVTLAPLSARYYFFQASARARQIVLDAGSMGVMPGFAWDAVVHRRDGTWAVEHLPNTGHAQLCDIDQFYLVLSNSLVPLDKKLEGSLTVRAREAPCGCDVISNQLDRIVGWNAQVRFDYNSSASDAEHRISTLQTAVLTSTLGLNSASATSYVSGLIEGNTAIHHQHELLYPNHTFLLSQIDGDGSPIPYDAERNSGSRITLNLNLARCTYVINASTLVSATIADDSSAYTGIVPVGMAGISPRPIESLTLSGSATLPAHSDSYIVLNGLQDFYTHNHTYYFAEILGEMVWASQRCHGG